MYLQQSPTLTLELEMPSSPSSSDIDVMDDDIILSSSVTTIGSMSPPNPNYSPRGPFEDLHLDLQGIPWARANITREQFRSNRMAVYTLYEHDRQYKTAVNVEEISGDCEYYYFSYMNRFEGCTVQHFQLKHLLHAPTPLTLFYPFFNRIKQSNPFQPELPSTSCFNLTESFGAAFSRISAFTVNESIGVVGGLMGELVVFQWFEKEHSSKITSLSSEHINAVVNHLQLHDDQVNCCCNDGHLRIININTMSSIARITTPWAVNCSAMHPLFPNLIGVVGDGRETRLIDGRTGITESILYGHEDYSFSIAWRPDGLHMATANQDRTVIIRDIRRPDRYLHRWRMRMSVPRSLAYHPDSRLLAIAEADDFVHLIDSSDSYQRVQSIDFFGDIAGVSFSPGCGKDRLYIACANPHQGGIICFDRDVKK